jgi:exopolyphosphatase/guanosine-5'-triphosphate,3'-diphosphate pyrophosphatase
MRKAPVAKTYAAVDLGSNSFHMIVASYSNRRIQIIDRIKKMIQLATGLDENDNLTESSMLRALECLEEFGQRIREIPRANVRVVGTNTLRQANNGKRFTTLAQKALGHPIEIIAGLEEARLIYSGVAHTAYDDTNKRLVVDIGGGSTELIIGKGFSTYRLESHYVGCVNMSRRFFNSGRITARNMENAIIAVRQELETSEGTFKKTGWRKTIGSSGTILTINGIVQNRGWSRNGITRSALLNLKNEVIKSGHVNRLNLPGLSDNRIPVFAGGLAILCGVFETFDLERMEVSDGALREGLLYDLIGRLHDEDIRDNTIDEMARRYNVDMQQAGRVRDTALQLFRQVADDWGLDRKSDLKYLEWAATIHEIGLAVAHAQHHRHGAYLIANADMAGFSRQDQNRLALLIRCHRRKYPLEEIASTGKDEREQLLRLSILLRLAVLLNRSRLRASPPRLKIRVTGKTLNLGIARKWLEKNPLTRTDMDSEQEYFRAIHYILKYRAS